MSPESVYLDLKRQHDSLRRLIDRGEALADELVEAKDDAREKLHAWVSRLGAEVSSHVLGEERLMTGLLTVQGTWGAQRLAELRASHAAELDAMRALTRSLQLQASPDRVSRMVRVLTASFLDDLDREDAELLAGAPAQAGAAPEP